MRPWASATDSAGVAALVVAGEFPRSMVADATVLQVAASTRTMIRQVLEWKYIMAVLGELEKIFEKVKLIGIQIMSEVDRNRFHESRRGGKQMAADFSFTGYTN
jgi:hypothetical protein